MSSYVGMAIALGRDGQVPRLFEMGRIETNDPGCPKPVPLPLQLADTKMSNTSQGWERVWTVLHLGWTRGIQRHQDIGHS